MMNWLQFITKFAFPAMQAPVPTMSSQEAHETCDQRIGPLYHGSSPEAASQILEQGFAWEEEEARVGGTSHGYENVGYGGGECPPPVHHLGYGIYLTQTRNIAKDYGYGSMRNVLEFWILKGSDVEEINFGSTNTMMKWWNANGYDCELARQDRVAATQQLTTTLSGHCDAVLYKGKGLYRLLDGNQICIYNPAILRRIDKKLAQSGEIGSTVIRIEDGMKGQLISRRSLEGFSEFHNGEPEFFTVKWRKGGTDLNVYPSQVRFE